MALDCYSTLPFNVHRIKDLVFGCAFIGDTGILDKPVGKGRLAMVNMGDNAKISYVIHNYTVKKAFRFFHGRLLEYFVMVIDYVSNAKRFFETS